MSDVSPDMLVLGAAHLDHRAGALPPFRPGASNPGRRTETLGGAAFNAVTAICALGRPVTFFGPRGGDASGAKVEEALAALGVRDLGITWLDRASPTYTAVTDDRGELVAGIADMELYGLVSPRMMMRRTLRDALAGATALLLDANFPAATLERAVSLAPPSCRIGAIAVSPAKVGALRPILSRLDALFLSKAEAATLTERPDAGIDTAIERLRAAGLRRAVVTDGPRAAAILDGEALHRQEPPRVEARDVTGAGDTLAGTAFHAFCNGTAWVESVRLGIAGASIRVSTAGFPPPNFGADVRRIVSTMAPAQRASA